MFSIEPEQPAHLESPHAGAQPVTAQVTAPVAAAATVPDGAAADVAPPARVDDQAIAVLEAELGAIEAELQALDHTVD